MKKLAVLAAAAMLVFSVAGQAAAFFEDFNLIRSIYSTGDVEVGTDLGLDVRTFSLNPTINPVNEQRNPDNALTLFDGGLGSLYVAYWAHGMTDRDFWATGWLTTAYGGTDTDGLFLLGKKQSTADALFNATQTLYHDSTTSETAILSNKTTTGAYYQAWDGLVVGSGKMATNLAYTSYEMDMNLAVLSTIGYVDQLLYYFDYDGSGTTKAGQEVAVIRTFLTSDGSTIDLNGDKIATVINPVPIPGSVLLLASGLLGLFGFRRKRA